jgi:hypothetical protein
MQAWTFNRALLPPDYVKGMAIYTQKLLIIVFFATRHKTWRSKNIGFFRGLARNSSNSIPPHISIKDNTGLGLSPWPDPPAAGAARQRGTVKTPGVMPQQADPRAHDERETLIFHCKTKT